MIIEIIASGMFSALAIGLIMSRNHAKEMSRLEAKLDAECANAHYYRHMMNRLVEAAYAATNIGLGHTEDLTYPTLNGTGDFGKKFGDLVKRALDAADLIEKPHGVYEYVTHRFGRIILQDDKLVWRWHERGDTKILGPVYNVDGFPIDYAEKVNELEVRSKSSWAVSEETNL